MRIELISTGNEVLYGEVADTNSGWIASRLAEFGYDVARVSTVGDQLQDLVAVFLERSKTSDVVLVNGGLGPTEDDLTSEAAAQASGKSRVVFPEWVSILKERYRDRNMPVSNLKQAELPEGSGILQNPRGTACGFSLPIGESLFFFTPGVPYEMKKMFNEEILPQIKKNFPVETPVEMKRLFTFGLSESRIGELASEHEVPGTNIGYRASFPLIEVKIKGDTQMLNEVVPCVRKALGDHVFCEDKGDAASTIQQLMLGRNMKLILSESCTGGLLASWLVAVPGSSAYFEGSVVTYSNNMKNKMLNVPEALLEQVGAVSEEVVAAMSVEALRRSSADVSLAVSGIAGPDGGTEEKPVGTVAFALTTVNRVYTQLLRFPPWGRGRIRHGSAMICLDMLRRFLTDRDVFAYYDYATRVSSEEH